MKSYGVETGYLSFSKRKQKSTSLSQKMAISGLLIMIFFLIIVSEQIFLLFYSLLLPCPHSLVRMLRHEQHDRIWKRGGSKRTTEHQR